MSRLDANARRRDTAFPGAASPPNVSVLGRRSVGREVTPIARGRSRHILPSGKGTQPPWSGSVLDDGPRFVVRLVRGSAALETTNSTATGHVCPMTITERTTTAATRAVLVSAVARIGRGLGGAARRIAVAIDTRRRCRSDGSLPVEGVSAGTLLCTATPSWLAIRGPQHRRRGRCGRSPAYNARNMSVAVRRDRREPERTLPTSRCFAIGPT